MRTLIAMLSFVLLVPMANAQSVLTVTTLADAGPGSLRDAIAAAAGGDTIRFDPGLSGTITLSSQLPTIDRNLVIDAGTYGTIAVSGADAVRLFRIVSGTVTLRGLTLRNGRGAGGAGGAPGGGGGLGAGGCLTIAGGSVTVDSVAFTDCSAVGGNGAGEGSGTGGGGGGSAAGNVGGSSIGNTGATGGTGFAPGESGGEGGDRGAFEGQAGTSATNGGFGAGGGGGGIGRFAGGGDGGNGGFGAGGGGGGHGTPTGLHGVGGTYGGDGSAGQIGSTGAGGGGGALGPAIFLRAGELTIVNSGDTGSVVTAGAGGVGAGDGTAVSGGLFSVPGPGLVTGALGSLPVVRALTVSTGGSGFGTVSSLPAGIDCGMTCAANFNHGTLVTMTATPLAGSRFDGWTGACSGTGACTVTMDAAKSVTATFVRQYTLTVTKAGAGSGSVVSTPGGIACGATCGADFDVGTVVTLTATPSDSANTFTGWSGACTGTGVCVVTMDAAKSVTATFVPKFQVLVSRTGLGSANGHVVSTPAGIDCGILCNTAFDSGTVVTLTPSAVGGASFVGWSGGACTGSGACTVTMTGPIIATAIFEQRYPITVVRAGSGTGTVTSNPARIDCGVTCSADFLAGTLARFNATPAPGSVFTGWSGACSGFGECEVDVNAAKTVTANFAPNLATVTNLNDAGPGSLRDAILSSGSGQTIQFAAGLSGLIPLASMLPVIDRDLVIDGGVPGTITLSGGGAVRILRIESGVVTLKGLVFKDGRGRGGDGGSGRGGGGGGGLGAGGCLFMAGGQVTLDSVRFGGCVAIGGNGGNSDTNLAGPGTSGSGGGSARGDAGVSGLAGIGQGGAGFQPGEAGGNGGAGPGGAPGLPGGFGAGGGGGGGGLPAGGGGQGGFGGGGGGGGPGSVVSGQVGGTLGGKGGDGFPFGGGGGGGGGAAGPAIFVQSGQITLVNVFHARSVAIAGQAGVGPLPTSTAGTADPRGIYAVPPATGTGPLFDAETLTVERGGNGRITSSPPGIDCGPLCSTPFSLGTVVSLTATADPGWVFSGWTGDCTGTGPCSVTMTGADRTVNATFTPAPATFALTIAKTGGGSGVITSTPGGIDCGATCAANLNAGSTVALGAAPSADSFFAGWSGGGCSGTGACNVTMDAAKSVTATFKLNTTIPRLVNIATRMQVLTGADVLIGGFIIGGSQPKTVVVRARGPSLIPLGVPNALANPVLQLFSGATQIDANDNWQQAANQATIQSSGFAPSDPLESAIYTTLNPGAYTAIVTGANLGTGVAIIEVFEVDLPQVPLLNIATRGKVLTGGDVMIGGFIIQGDAPQKVVVRARGPSLTAQGVPGALQDTVLQLFAGQAVIATNDDWQASPDAATIQSSGFAPSDTRESVIRITLNPGAYTAIVSGKNGTTGVGIIEVFAQ